MAFPVVEGTATSDEASDVTAHVVTLPGSIVSGETLVVWIGGIKFTSVTFSPPGGWTELDDTYVSKTGAAVLYRIADGTEGGTITVTSSSAVKSGSVALRISGAGDTPEIAVFGAASNSNSPDPPNLTPSWGSADTLWLASGVSSQGKHSATPANYTDIIKSPVWNSFGQTFVARRELAAASENPGAFTIDWSGDLWVAQTLAIEPGGGADHTLLADDVESASEVSTPGVSQKHVITADDVESASEVSTPSVGQVHALLVDDVESATEVSTPTAAHKHVLLADDVESASEVSTPAVAQVHALLGDDVESATEVSTPAVGQLHALLGDDVEAATEVSTPSVTQLHVLLADDVESASEVSTPTAADSGVDHVLLADDVESATEVSTPAVAQVHALLADDVESASEVSTPALTQLHSLLADDLESASEVSTPTAVESHVLAADDLESASEVSTPEITHIFSVFTLIK